MTVHIVVFAEAFAATWATASSYSRQHAAVSRREAMDSSGASLETTQLSNRYVLGWTSADNLHQRLLDRE